MAHFIGIAQGNKGETSRLGTKNSGLKTIANGWDIGGEVELSHEDGMDVLRFYVTGGSNASGQKDLIYEVKEIANGRSK